MLQWGALAGRQAGGHTLPTFVPLSWAWRRRPLCRTCARASAAPTDAHLCKQIVATPRVWRIFAPPMVSANTSPASANRMSEVGGPDIQFILLRRHSYRNIRVAALPKTAAGCNPSGGRHRPLRHASQLPVRQSKCFGPLSCGAGGGGGVGGHAMVVPPVVNQRRAPQRPAAREHAAAFWPRCSPICSCARRRFAAWRHAGRRPCAAWWPRASPMVAAAAPTRHGGPGGRGVGDDGDRAPCATSLCVRHGFSQCGPSTAAITRAGARARECGDAAATGGGVAAATRCGSVGARTRARARARPAPGAVDRVPARRGHHRHAAAAARPRGGSGAYPSTRATQAVWRRLRSRFGCSAHWRCSSRVSRSWHASPLPIKYTTRSTRTPGQ